MDDEDAAWPDPQLTQLPDDRIFRCDIGTHGCAIPCGSPEERPVEGAVALPRRSSFTHRTQKGLYSLLPSGPEYGPIGVMVVSLTVSAAPELFDHEAVLL